MALFMGIRTQNDDDYDEKSVYESLCRRTHIVLVIGRVYLLGSEPFSQISASRANASPDSPGNMMLFRTSSAHLRPVEFQCCFPVQNVV